MSAALRISGHVVGRCVTSASPKGEAFVHVQLHQGGASLPLRAVRSLGMGGAAHFAARGLANQLRDGTPITVHADHLELRRKPDLHLLIVGVDRIDHPLPTDHTEPQEATTP